MGGVTVDLVRECQSRQPQQAQQGGL